MDTCLPVPSRAYRRTGKNDVYSPITGGTAARSAKAMPAGSSGSTVRGGRGGEGPAPSHTPAVTGWLGLPSEVNRPRREVAEWPRLRSVSARVLGGLSSSLSWSLSGRTKEGAPEGVCHGARVPGSQP